MRQTSGITIERSPQGIPIFARIDLIKYGEKLMPFFREVGAVNEISPYNKEYIKMINQAEEDIEAGKGKKLSITDLWK
jgi:hypothetical protein